MRIDLGDIEFNNGLDGDGIAWIVTNHSGWDDVPTYSPPILSNLVRHGGSTVPSFLGQRIVTLEGVVRAPSVALYEQAKGQLVDQALRFGDPVDLVFFETINKKCSVIAAAAPKIRILAPGTFEFQVSVVAEDPIKYDVTGDSTATSGSFNAVNDGNFPVWPTLTLGATGTVLITNTTVTGAPFVQFSSLPNGTVINFNDRTVLDGSINRYDTIQPNSEWWALLPGTNAITYSGASATLSWNNGYM